MTPLRLLFFLRIARLDRLYPSFLETLLDRGHEIVVVVERERPRDLAPGGGSILDDLAQRYPERFRVERLVKPADRWRHLRSALRMGVDYLRYFDPAYRDAGALRERASARTPGRLRPLVRLFGKTAAGRRAGRRLFLFAERAIPLSAGWRDEIARHAPDAVLVSPLVSLGSPQSNWLRAARKLGIPTVLPVASWDNLSNKGVLKETPTLTIVWNEAQADEAVTLHAVPRGRVAVTGAHSFDHWFERAPSTTRAEYAQRVGLPDDHPFFLYVCSSKFIAGDERPFVAEWLQHFRSRAELRDLNVVVRPHPFNAAEWGDLDLGDKRAVITPRGGEIPAGEAGRAAYFDAIHHSLGTVGLSTSVFVEAAILDRPSFTVRTDRYRATQEGTLHFGHVTGPGGVVVVAAGWDEHLDQLAEQAAEPERHVQQARAFVDSFVRPRGRDLAAAPFAADAVEGAAA